MNKFTHKLIDLRLIFIYQQQYQVLHQRITFKTSHPNFILKIPIVDSFRQQHRTFSQVLQARVPRNRSPLHS